MIPIGERLLQLRLGLQDRGIPTHHRLLEPRLQRTHLSATLHVRLGELHLQTSDLVSSSGLLKRLLQPLDFLPTDNRRVLNLGLERAHVCVAQRHDLRETVLELSNMGVAFRDGLRQLRSKHGDLDPRLHDGFTGIARVGFRHGQLRLEQRDVLEARLFPEHRVPELRPDPVEFILSKRNISGRALQAVLEPQQLRGAGAIPQRSLLQLAAQLKQLRHATGVRRVGRPELLLENGELPLTSLHPLRRRREFRSKRCNAPLANLIPDMRSGQLALESFQRAQAILLPCDGLVHASLELIHLLRIAPTKALRLAEFTAKPLDFLGPLAVAGLGRTEIVAERIHDHLADLLRIPALRYAALELFKLRVTPRFPSLRVGEIFREGLDDAFPLRIPLRSFGETLLQARDLTRSLAIPLRRGKELIHQLLERKGPLSVARIRVLQLRSQSIQFMLAVRIEPPRIQPLRLEPLQLRRTLTRPLHGGIEFALKRGDLPTTISLTHLRGLERLVQMCDLLHPLLITQGERLQAGVEALEFDRVASIGLVRLLQLALDRLELIAGHLVFALGLLQRRLQAIDFARIETVLLAGLLQTASELLDLFLVRLATLLHGAELRVQLGDGCLARRVLFLSLPEAAFQARDLGPVALIAPVGRLHLGGETSDLVATGFIPGLRLLELRLQLRELLRLTRLLLTGLRHGTLNRLQLTGELLEFALQLLFRLSRLVFTGLLRGANLGLQALHDLRSLLRTPRLLLNNSGL